jgi:tetratricopeptide (TPR) repeat protein
MKYSSKLMLGIGLLALAMPATAQNYGGARKQEPQKVATGAKVKLPSGREVVLSPKASAAIVELQTAVRAKDAAAIRSKLAVAQREAKSADEKYLVAMLHNQAAMDANDLDGIKASIEAIAASGSQDATDVAARYIDLGKRYRAAGRTAEADALVKQSASVDPSNPAALALMADAKAKAGDKAGAADLMRQSIAAARAKGQKPAESNYRFAVGNAFESKHPAAAELAAQWVAAYPAPDSWRTAIQIFRGTRQATPAQLVDIMRLARTTDALKTEADYHAYADALVKTGQLAEAKAVLAEAGRAPGVDLTKPQFKQVAAKTGKAQTRAAVDAQAQAALAGGDAAALIAAGDALYGQGAYAEAVPLYRAAIAKGGDANLHLGMALARSGDKAGAEAALKAVTGANKLIADYWLGYVGTLR